MNTSASEISLAPRSHGAFVGSRSNQVEQTRVGSLSSKRSTDLTLTTHEGDTVTLSLASAIETNAGIYRSDPFEDGRGTFSLTAFSEFFSSQDLSIEVNGDLNQEELEDIRDAMQVIGTMIDDFLSGDLEAMAEDGELLKELDTISSLETAFSYERQVLYGEQEKVEISRTAPEKGHHSHRRGHGRLRQLMNRIDRLTDDMVDAVKGFRGRRKHLASAVEGLFNQYGTRDAGGTPEDEFERGVLRTTQSTFYQKLQTLSESTRFNFTYAA